jgi:hypothetical protein
MPKYKLTEDGKIEVKDGHPVLIGDDGKEFTVDAIGAQATITKLHAEAAEHRKKSSERGKQLEAFGDIDPVKAREALTTVANLSADHKLEIENLKAGLNKTWQEKHDAEIARNKVLSDALYKATVTTKFATSEVVKKTILTPDIAAKFFGEHFGPDGTAKDSTGNPIYSKSKPGELADFDEALEVLIENYPNKASILRGSGADGSGAHTGQGGPSHPSAKFYDRKSPEFNISEQAKLANTNPTLHTQLKSVYK